MVPIAKGQVKWATGMSEPNAGTDTFNIALKAVEESDGYVLNGQKIWTSNAHHAKYLMMFTRTDPANKHMGLTAIVVDAEEPGHNHAPDCAADRHSGLLRGVLRQCEGARRRT